MNLLHPLNLDLNPGNEASQCCTEQHGSDQRKTDKQKSFAQSSSQCHQIIRYQQKLALRLWRREYYGKKDKGEFYYHLPCGIEKW